MSMLRGAQAHVAVQQAGCCSAATGALYHMFTTALYHMRRNQQRLLTKEVAASPAITTIRCDDKIHAQEH